MIVISDLKYLEITSSSSKIYGGQVTKTSTVELSTTTVYDDQLKTADIITSLFTQDSLIQL
jgi:hypothetical protein